MLLDKLIHSLAVKLSKIGVVFMAGLRKLVAVSLLSCVGCFCRVQAADTIAAVAGVIDEAQVGVKLKTHSRFSYANESMQEKGALGTEKKTMKTECGSQCGSEKGVEARVKTKPCGGSGVGDSGS